jgi:hypothetical protein
VTTPLAAGSMRYRSTARSTSGSWAQDVMETADEGISAKVGSHAWLSMAGRLHTGKIRVVCEIHGRVASTFVLEDRLRPDAGETFGRIL